MMKNFRHSIVICLAAALCLPVVAATNPRVVLQTNAGDVVIELYPDKAPITVDNFLSYVNSGFYDGLLFHRVIYEFMIQGGGYYLDGYTIIPYPPTNGPIINESYNGLSNLRGTIAMARTSDPDSATSQFFINHVDNPFLDRENASDGYGYCVFGQVVYGLDVIDAIALVETCSVSSSLANFPCNPPVIIYQAYVKPCEAAYCANLSGSSQVHFQDFAVFASGWLDECGSADDFCGGSDFNYDGLVDVQDLSLFLMHWHRTAGWEIEFSDLNPDGRIDADDLSVLMTHWLDTGCTESNGFCGGGDIDRDGTVNLVDLRLFSGNWLASY